jgi:hypothetical protein
MLFAVAVLRIPVSYMYSVLTVITGNGTHYPVVTGVAQRVKTMNPVNGLTDNRASYYLFLIFWQLLHCLMN